ncbi:MAG: hypothetical protein ACI957_005144, partial [Verrucomicrobiales bacterium]
MINPLPSHESPCALALRFVSHRKPERPAKTFRRISNLDSNDTDLGALTPKLPRAMPL